MVDRDGLENRCTLTGTQGSNPCLSAEKSCKSPTCSFFRRKGSGEKIIDDESFIEYIAEL